MTALFFFLLVQLGFAPEASAGTMYTQTREYPWQWGSAPADFDSGMDQIRTWLEEKKRPKLITPNPALERATRRFFKLEDNAHVFFAVMAPPRSRNGHDPHFFAWVEWVHKSKFGFDLDQHRWVRKAGIAKVAIEGAGEAHLEIREWFSEQNLKEKELEEILPWDAAVIARKMVDFHDTRPRLYRERANGRGKSAPY